MVRFEIDEEIKHRLLNGLDDIAITLRERRRDRRLRGGRQRADSRPGDDERCERQLAVDWDAATYDRLADPQEEWGREVLARLELDGDETVLDAGCGSGRVTRLLLGAAPAGQGDRRRRLAVDDRRSPASSSPATATGSSSCVSDLLELELDDAGRRVFSNATFHWILDHDRLFARLLRGAAPGRPARGPVRRRGQRRRVEARRSRPPRATSASPPTCAGCPTPRTSPRSATPRTRLERAGFEVESRLARDRTVDAARAAGSSSAPSGSPSTSTRCPTSLRDEFVDAVLGSMPKPLTLEYVRLNISARRP